MAEEASLFLLCFIVPAFIDCVCVHDRVQQRSVLRTHVHYRTTDRGKRSTAYHPLRISTFFIDLRELNAKQHTNFTRVINSTVREIGKILSVVRTQGQLLLSRSSDACQTKWFTGPNKHRCSTISRNYKGEFCLNIKIPNKHLEGLYIWEKTQSLPVREVVAPGPGVAASDYILYVTSRASSKCWVEGNQVIAYASYCQLDQNGRPVAGAINFCPMHLNTGSFNTEQMYQVALHEFFHALGFSKNLFCKFQKHTQDHHTACVRQKVLNGSTHFDIARLILPTVVAQTQQHFGCNQSDFGPLLELRDDKSIGSHWDERFMHTSLMVSIGGPPHLTLVDRITLAVLEDSSWYRVNYERAGQFDWGRCAGCRFGLPEMCINDTKFFCAGSIKGCHFLLKNRGTCKSSSYLTPCRVFKVKAGDECFTPKAEKDETDDGQLFSPRSRCFISNISKSSFFSPVGLCYEHRCGEEHVVEVRVQGSGWLPCPVGSTIQVPGYKGSLQCPKIKGILCSDEKMSSLVTPTSLFPSVRTTQQQTIPVVVFPFSLFFMDMDSKILSEAGRQHEFQQAVIEKIVQILGIRPERLTNVQLTAGRVVVSLDLLPADNDLHSEEVYHILSKAVKSGAFRVVLYSTGQSFTATSIQSNFPSTTVKNSIATSHQLNAGEIVGIIILVLVFSCGVCIITSRLNCCSRFTSSAENIEHTSVSLVREGAMNVMARIEQGH